MERAVDYESTSSVDSNPLPAPIYASSSVELEHAASTRRVGGSNPFWRT